MHENTSFPNNYQSIGWMKKFIAFLLVSMTAMPSHGQSSQGRYASRITPDGTIFFINPHKLGSLRNLIRFEYDMTLPDWTDSVTVNFTFESSWMNTLENLEIASGGNVYPCEEFSVLFIDIKKHHYKIRVTSKFSVQELTEIVESESIPVFSFTQNGIQKKAEYKSKDWKKERPKLLDILSLYHYSKK